MSAVGRSTIGRAAPRGADLLSALDRRAVDISLQGSDPRRQRHGQPGIAHLRRDALEQQRRGVTFQRHTGKAGTGMAAFADWTDHGLFLAKPGSHSAGTFAVAHVP